MHNSYLEVFDNLFFNVEKHENVKNSIEQASCVLDSVITKFGEVINEMAAGISGTGDFVDIVVILFTRKIIEQLDSINVLYSVSLFEPTQTILRSMIENIVELLFILKDDTDKRAAAYFLERHYQDLDKGDAFFDDKSKYVKLLIAQKGKDELECVQNKILKKREAINRLTQSEKIFQEIDNSRKKKLADKKNNNKAVYIKWYEVCSNITNFYGLMKETGYEDYYDAIYGGLSLESHGFNSTMGINATEEGFSLKWIRNPQDGGTTFALACNFSISVLQKIYQYLGDEESEKAEFKTFFEDFVKKRDEVSRNLDMI